jgi:hypothetical protein
MRVKKLCGLYRPGRSAQEGQKTPQGQKEKEIQKSFQEKVVEAFCRRG